ncbi:mucin-2-like isoform X2 [Planococcus citri]|uniref:mucin-2-like isoform X2 n=1 Tax=Planococcus citri TaxID=170843 RepID=UPI0031F75CCE
MQPRTRCQLYKISFCLSVWVMYTCLIVQFLNYSTKLPEPKKLGRPIRDPITTMKNIEWPPTITDHDTSLRTDSGSATRYKTISSELTTSSYAITTEADTELAKIRHINETDHTSTNTLPGTESVTDTTTAALQTTTSTTDTTTGITSTLNTIEYTTNPYQQDTDSTSTVPAPTATELLEAVSITTDTPVFRTYEYVTGMLSTLNTIEDSTNPSTIPYNKDTDSTSTLPASTSAELLEAVSTTDTLIFSTYEYEYVTGTLSTLNTIEYTTNPSTTSYGRDTEYTSTVPASTTTEMNVGTEAFSVTDIPVLEMHEYELGFQAVLQDADKYSFNTDTMSTLTNYSTTILSTTTTISENSSSESTDRFFTTSRTSGEITLTTEIGE